MSGLRRLVSAATRPRQGEKRPIYPEETFVGRYMWSRFAGAEPIEVRKGGTLSPGWLEVIGHRMLRAGGNGRISRRKDIVAEAGAGSMPLVNDLNNPQTIAYVNRVEGIARRVKATALAAGGAIAAALITHKVFGGDVSLATDSLGQAGNMLGVTTQESSAAVAAQTAV